MADTFTFKQETSETGTSKTPAYGARILAIATLLLLVADTEIPAALAVVTLGLATTALTLCARMQPTIVTIRESLPAPEPQPEPVHEPETPIPEPESPDPF